MSKRPRKKVRDKLLFDSGKICSMPDCNVKLTNYEHENESDLSIFAHIEAYEKGGARYNPKMTEEERQDESNFIVVCHNCHKIIDDNPEYYTVEKLKKIKRKHISAIKNQRESLIAFNNYDLSYVVRSIINENEEETNNKKPLEKYKEDYDLIDIELKMNKNKLSISSSGNILNADVQHDTVKEFIANRTKEDENFASILRNILKKDYDKLKIKHQGDMLFMALYSKYNIFPEKRHQGALLSIITYFFIICELFEK